MIPAPDLPPVEEAVADALAEWVTERCEAVDVEVHQLGIQRDLYKDGVHFHWSGNPCASNPRVNLSVALDSGEQRRFVAQPQLTVWVNAPVAPRAYAAGDR